MSVWGVNWRQSVRESQVTDRGRRGRGREETRKEEKEGFATRQRARKEERKEREREYASEGKSKYGCAYSSSSKQTAREEEHGVLTS